MQDAESSWYILVIPLFLLTLYLYRDDEPSQPRDRGWGMLEDAPYYR